jgi:hydroxyacylglutathione hydrolase
MTAKDLLVQTFVVGPLAVNTYVLADPQTKKACVIDPGGDGPTIEKFLKKNGLNVEFVINTHGHGDHIAANSRFGAPIYIHKLDADFLIDPDKNLSSNFLFSVTSPKASHLLEDNDRLQLGALELDIIHTPGHTPGSISIRVGGVVFTGDALFSGSVGRTDFEYGDEQALLKAVRERLFCLDDDTIVYPGHGPSTTIGREKRSNPFFN